MLRYFPDISKFYGFVVFIKSVFENIETDFYSLEFFQEPESREDQLKKRHLKYLKIEILICIFDG